MVKGNNIELHFAKYDLKVFECVLRKTNCVQTVLASQNFNHLNPPPGETLALPPSLPHQQTLKEMDFSEGWICPWKLWLGLGP